LPGRRNALETGGDDQGLPGAGYLPTLAAIRHNPAVRRFYTRLVERGRAKMAAVGACLRKLVMICYGMLKGRAPFDRNRTGVRPAGGVHAVGPRRLAAYGKSSRSRPEGDRTIAKSNLWPHFAGPQVPAATSVDVTCAPCTTALTSFGGSDRSAL
jgi:hypothetical protein